MFDFNDYIALAEQLNKKTDEASKRTAVSRAYYGALMRAKKHLKQKGKLPADLSGGDTHKKIWDALAGLGGKGSREEHIAKKGKKLKGRREQADYEPIIKDNIAAWSQLGLSMAKGIISDIDDL